MFFNNIWLSRVMGVILGIIVAEGLFMIFSFYKDKSYIRRREASKKEQLLEAEKLRLESSICAGKREQYYKQIRPLLYFNTVAGITAVMTPDEYKRAQKETSTARINETWQNENVLLPSACRPFLFVTNSGKKQIDGVMTTMGWVFSGYTWYNQLHELLEEFNVDFQQKQDIFVPFVNETLVPYEEHKVSERGYGYCHSLEGCLIGYSTPKEMHDPTWR